MDLGIRGESALIMSSTRGLGFACAKALVAEGVRVVINGRDHQRGTEAAAALGQDALFIQADLTEPSERKMLLSRAQEHFGLISILVTNVDGPPPMTFLDSTSENWSSAFDSVVQPSLEIVRLGVPQMVENGFGRVVNISSISAKEITLKGLLANGLRPALIGAFGTLAREVAPHGITVNSILPGPFDTDSLRRVAREHADHEDVSEEKAVQAYADSGPMKRLGDPDELGALCAFLCSRLAGHINGQSVVVDGGRIRTLL